MLAALRALLPMDATCTVALPEPLGASVGAREERPVEASVEEAPALGACAYLGSGLQAAELPRMLVPLAMHLPGLWGERGPGLGDRLEPALKPARNFGLELNFSRCRTESGREHGSRTQLLAI